MMAAKDIVIKAILGVILLVPAILAPAGSMADYVRIKGTVVNVRQGPGTTFPVLFQAEQGEEFNLSRTEGLWCLIDLGEGKEAWVFGRLVEILPGQRPSQTDQQSGAGVEDVPRSVWVVVLETILLIVIFFLAGLALWKRRLILDFTRMKLREISGYRREQPFRYDNRTPRDDSWEL